MPTDPLYFPRTEYAQRLLASLADGITHAFTLFAPRRMGKTQFLLNDIAPMAENMGFNVFYFSFMDDSPETVSARFQTALYRFAADSSKIKTFIASIKKLDIAGSGLEREIHHEMPPVSDIIGHIASSKRPTLLLLDEVQELARIRHSDGLIRALRTGLDINQRQIKTIFTGSSTNGLRTMFHDSKAPFFHFAHHLDFPVFGREFTDFLAAICEQRNHSSLNRDAFYRAFERLNHTPLYMRAMAQDMIVNPALSIEEATQIRIEQMQENSGFAVLWAELTALEKLILRQVATGGAGLYGTEIRQAMAEELGVNSLNTSTIQGAIRKLTRKELLTRDAGNALQINSPLLKTWISESTL